MSQPETLFNTVFGENPKYGRIYQDEGGLPVDSLVTEWLNCLFSNNAVKPPSVLQEADSLVNGARQKDYGHPIDDFSRTAAMWTAILGVPVTAEQVGLCMCAVKISRECNKPKRDNLVDLAGYAGTIDMVKQERERRSLKNECT